MVALKRRPAAAASGGRPRKRQRAEAVEEPEPDLTDEWSYDRLWDAPEVSDGWHTRNLRFWRSQAADVRGATGGGVSRGDLAFTRGVLEELVRERGGKRFSSALDCGAGIGRVTDAVLRRCCCHVDLMEFVRKHLAIARARLPAAGKSGCTFGFHCSSAQNFDIAPGKYDLIWCQWLLMYLTDEDALDLLRRARKGLAPGGLLLLKENVSTADKATYFDDADGELWLEGISPGAPVSCVRTPMHYEDLLERAGLRAQRERRQTDETGRIMDMVLYELVPDQQFV
mmetsp:Transcript_23081/g.72557  ORF Transcript_23081/g.72557 Transcript_23081/m.72557 type:complete len:284 (+) Transcript_23081:47-898(+)